MAKTKTEAAAAISDAEFVATARVRALKAAEAILTEKAPDFSFTADDPNRVQAWNVRSKFTDEELHVFDFLNWSRQDLVHEIARVSRVLALQRVAGTAAERQAAVEQLAEAQEELRARKPALEEQIAKLQQELLELERPVPRLERLIANQEEAVAKLREEVPAHVRAEYVRRKKNVRENYHDQISSLEASLRKAELPLDQPQKQQLDERIIGARMAGLSPAVSDANTRHAELVRLRGELEAVKAQRQKELDAIEAELLDIYRR